MKFPVACPLCGDRLKSLQVKCPHVPRWEGVFSEVDEVLFCPKCQFVFPVAHGVPLITEERYMIYDGIVVEPGEKTSIPILCITSPDTGEKYRLEISGFWSRLWIKLWTKLLSRLKDRFTSILFYRKKF